MALLVLDSRILYEVFSFSFSEFYESLAHHLFLAQLLHQQFVIVFDVGDNGLSLFVCLLVLLIPVVMQPVRVEVDQIFDQISGIAFLRVFGVCIVVSAFDDGHPDFILCQVRDKVKFILNSQHDVIDGNFSYFDQVFPLPETFEILH